MTVNNVESKESKIVLNNLSQVYYVKENSKKKNFKR